MPFVLSTDISAVPLQETIAVTCPQATTPAVTLDYEMRKPVVHNDRTLKALSTMTPSIAVNRREFPITSGFTHGSIMVSYEVKIAYRLQDRQGLYCLWPQSAHIHIKYAPDIYVAKDYKPGSCRYKDTLQHEMRHVQADRDIVKAEMPALLQKMREGLADLAPGSPLRAADMKSGESSFLRRVKALMSDNMRRISALRLKKQGAIDTRAEYLRASHACAR